MKARFRARSYPNPMEPNYYPRTVAGRADWWGNILEKADEVLPPLGFAAGRVTAIKADAEWAKYCYGTLRNTFEGFTAAIIAYANTITSGIGGGPGTGLPAPLVVPALPTAPIAVIARDIEARREAWVQEVKKAPGYTAAAGEQLRIIAPEDSFDPSTYIAELRGLMCSGPHTVSGKFRKARGNADGIALRGRKVGTVGWIDLGRYTATPFSALVPLAGAEPEAWEFQAQAVRRDVLFGLPSPNTEVLVKA